MESLHFDRTLSSIFFFSSRRRHTRYIGDWSSDVCSSDLGETPVAFVVLKTPIASGELLAWANARLGKTQRIAALEIVDALPRSPIGKVLKQIGRASCRERV